MPPVTQRIANLLGGVSQQAPHRRRPNELEASTNAYASPAKGYGKRPNTDHVALLSNTPADFTFAEIARLDYGAGARFLAAFLDSDVRVWDENGVAQTVNYPNGKTYLNVGAAGSVRFATADKRTFVTNREVKALRSLTEKAAFQTPKALVYVEQADYSTTYAITIDGTAVTYKTTAGADPGDRRLIATDNIVTELRTRLEAAFSDFTFDQFGSFILVQRTDAAEFSISSTDGLADNGCRILKGSVQRSADLPLRCVDGFVLEVVGDPEDSRDNYWVKFATNGSDDYRGVWKEAPRPGEGIAFNPATLPHELVYSDELTAELENRAFPPLPSTRSTDPTRYDGVWSGSLNGGAADALAYLKMDEQGEDYFLNLANATGGPVRVSLRYDVSTTRLVSGETLYFNVYHNDGTGSTTWTLDETVSFPPGVYLKDQLLEVEVTANMGAGFDIKVDVTYAGGATPSGKGEIRLLPLVSNSLQYFVYTTRELTWKTDTVYPKGTLWTVTVDGTDVTYTQTADLTGAQLAAAIQPGVDALTGITATTVTNTTGTAIRITKDAGGLPTCVTTAAFNTDVNFWDPDLLLGYADDALVGKTVKNLSDGSSGTVTANYGSGITVDALTGGVENTFRGGDRIIVVAAAKQFVFREVAWAKRDAGSAVTNPWPSFVDDYIRDVFYHQGRLGFLAGGNIIMSEASKPDNFFRTATTDLLDSDPIDVRWAGGANALFHSATPWNGDLVVWGDRVQVVPKGEPVLSPRTIKLDLLCAYPCDPTARPEPAGQYVFFGRPLSSQTQVQALGISPRTRVAEARDLTDSVPSYLSGTPLRFAADPALGLAFVQTTGSAKTLYVLRYQDSEDGNLVTSWGKWTFTGDLLGFHSQDGTLVLVMKYADGVYLETLDLSENY